MSEQKVTMERLEEEMKASQVSQGQSLNELEASVVSRLHLLVGQWNDEIQKVTVSQRTANKSFSQHFN